MNMGSKKVSRQQEQLVCINKLATTTNKQSEETKATGKFTPRDIGP